MRCQNEGICVHAADEEQLLMLTASCYFDVHLINNTLIFVIKMTLAGVLPGNTASRVDLITVNGERECSLVEINQESSRLLSVKLFSFD